MRAHARRDATLGAASLDRAGVAQAERQNDEPPATDEVGTVFFRVVDKATKQPLRAVNLRVRINGKVAHEHKTDDMGQFRFRLPNQMIERATVTARRDGFVPMKVFLRNDGPSAAEIPRYYKLAMERGTSIGGIVRTEDGRPIEGVTVTFYDNSPEGAGREAYDFDELSARTDLDGRWQIDLIPAGLDLGRLHFTFSHPEFLSSVDAVNNQPSATPKELRSKSGVLVLRRGSAVSGRVLDRGGRPIAGARVRLGEHGRVSNAETDAFGRFHIKNAERRQTVVTAEAVGYAPEMQPVNVQSGLPELEIRLGPGKTIRGRVVDSQGRAIVGANVGAFNWRGRQTLAWRVATDDEGRFRWDNAPGDDVSVVASKPGYSSSEVTLSSAKTEHIVTLARGLLVRGTVVDADTGKAINAFTIVPGVMSIWMPGFAKTRHGGRYEFPFEGFGIQPRRIRIEAEGYRPAVSPLYNNDAGEQVFDVRLEKGDWVKGVVRGLDGAPLDGAEVIIATLQGIHIGGGRAYQRDYHPHVLTGPDGEFALSPPDAPYRLIALHDQGYAEASGDLAAKARGMTLERWGRIEGTLRVDGRSLARETVIASLDDERIDMPAMQIQNENRAQTDDQGRFVIERVVPGEARIHWQPEAQATRRRPDRFYQALFRHVSPGETIRVDLTLQGGRPLVGRVAAGDRTVGRLELAGSNAYIVLKTPEVPYPPGLAEPARREWLRLWRFTEEGSEYRRFRRGFAHPMELQPDGSFRIDEIQPGAYQMHVRAKGFEELVHDFEVPEPTAGQGGTPIDLGTLTLKRSP
jgi:hypothetical protein